MVCPGGLVVVRGLNRRAYVWSGYENRTLLRLWQAHYRPVTTLAFSSSGGTLLTGESNDMLYSWILQDPMDKSNNNCNNKSKNNGNNNDNVNSVHRWSEHHLYVTALHDLQSNRTALVSINSNIIVIPFKPTHGVTHEIFQKGTALIQLGRAPREEARKNTKIEGSRSVDTRQGLDRGTGPRIKDGVLYNIKYMCILLLTLVSTLIFILKIKLLICRKK